MKNLRSCWLSWVIPGYIQLSRSILGYLRLSRQFQAISDYHWQEVAVCWPTNRPTCACASIRGACAPKNVRLDIQKRVYVFYTLYISDTIASQRFAIIENLDWYVCLVTELFSKEILGVQDIHIKRRCPFLWVIWSIKRQGFLPIMLGLEWAYCTIYNERYQIWRT